MRVRDCVSCCVSGQRVTDDQDFERRCPADGEGYNRGHGRATSTREVRRECDDSRGYKKKTNMQYEYSSKIRRTKKMEVRSTIKQSTVLNKIQAVRVMRRRDGEAARWQIGASATR